MSVSYCQVASNQACPGAPAVTKKQASEPLAFVEHQSLGTSDVLPLVHADEIRADPASRITLAERFKHFLVIVPCDRFSLFRSHI